VASIQDALEDARGDGFRPPDINITAGTVREGWSTASAVSFVAQAFETVRMTHEDAPALSVISKILRSMYLHREIREKGGAYGGFAIYNPEDGLFCFGSYRDPHIVTTLNVYRNAADFVRTNIFSDEDIKEAILQVCSEIDKPDPPGPTARKAFYRKIISLSDEMRHQFKSRLLELTRKHVKTAAETKNHSVVVISSEEKLNAANEKLADRPLELHRI
jgi:Zn-dependent M16 (insulinase) family peptidase